MSLKNNGRILIVDDDRQYLNMIHAILRDEGFEVQLCTDVREGLEQVILFDPDVLLLDWQMPNVTGIEMIGTIRQGQKNEDIYIVMLSGKIMTDDIVTAFKAGADDYVIKPFSPEELIARVFHGVKSRRRLSADGQQRERIFKELKKIETLAQQLTTITAKDKRSSSLAADLKKIASELKDTLKLYLP